MTSKFADIAPRIWAGVATDEEMASIALADVIAIKSDTSALHYRFTARAKSIDKSARTASYVASTETVDRSGDIVLVKGWKLDGYARNPQFLMEHMPSLGPLGLATEVRKGTHSGVRALMADVAVHDEDKLNEHTRLRSRLVLDGDVVGMSVGYIPIDPYRPQSEEERKRLGLGRYGVLYRSQELFELSSVLIPDNAEAVQKKLAALVESGEVSESLARDVARDWSASPRVQVRVAKVFDDLAAEDAPADDAPPADEPASTAAVEPDPATPSLAEQISAIQAQLDALKSHLSSELAELKSALATSAASSPASPSRDPKPEAESANVSRGVDPQAFYGAALAVPFLRYRKGRNQ